MKSKRIKSLLLLGAALLILVISCELIEEPISMKDRLWFFKDDLNKDAGRTKIYQNLHPDRQAAFRDPSAWGGTLYYGNKPFSYKFLTYSFDAEGIVGTVRGQLVWAFDEQTVSIRMKKSEGDWYITHMTVDPDGTPTELFP